MLETQNNWIDVSIPLTSGMVHWPGDPAPSFERISEIEQGSEVNLTFCRMTAHTGTHMDAPCHFIAGGAGIETFPLSIAIGRAKVISVPNAAIVTKADLASQNIQPGDRILLRTRNSNQRWDDKEFYTSYAAIDAGAAQFLLDRGIALIGVDYLSVGAFEGDGMETHRLLLGGGVWIVEGLNLSAVADGDYEMICLPLKIIGADGAPARVALRKIEY